MAKKGKKRAKAKKKTTGKKVAKKKVKKKVNKKKKTKLVFLKTAHSKAKLTKALPDHDLAEFEMWVRQPDSKKAERLVTAARLCGQKKSCITAIEQV